MNWASLRVVLLEQRLADRGGRTQQRRQEPRLQRVDRVDRATDVLLRDRQTRAVHAEQVRDIAQSLVEDRRIGVHTTAVIAVVIAVVVVTVSLRRTNRTRTSTRTRTRTGTVTRTRRSSGGQVPGLGDESVEEAVARAELSGLVQRHRHARAVLARLAEGDADAVQHHRESLHRLQQVHVLQAQVRGRGVHRLVHVGHQRVVAHSLRRTRIVANATATAIVGTTTAIGVVVTTIGVVVTVCVAITSSISTRCEVGMTRR